MRQKILSINGYILVVVGFVFVALGLIAYFAGVGPFKVMLHDSMPLAILPFTEAFALAALFGIVFVRTSKQPQYSPFWNQLACIIHFILGSCNVVFWPFFASGQHLKIPGVIATILHFTLASAELYAWRLYQENQENTE